jgi:hypothetical protein
MSTTKMLLGGGLVLAALFSGGTAYTAGMTNQPTNQTLGFGSTTVDGATVDSLHYNHDISGSDDVISSVDLVLHGNLTTVPVPTVLVGFNFGPESSMYSCTPGTFASSATPFNCVVTRGDTVSSVLSTQILVTSPNTHA